MNKKVYISLLLFALVQLNLSCVPERPVSVATKQELSELPRLENRCGSNASERLILNQNQFKEWWNSDTQSKWPGEKSIEPVIDFERYAVVVICFGTFTHGGYQFGIDRMETYRDKTIIFYREVIPPRNAKTAAVIFSYGITQVVPRPERMPVLFKKIEVQEPDLVQ